jgi:threonine synthase
MIPTVRCQGCGREVRADGATPFVCPAAGADAGDHVLAHVLALPLSLSDDGDPNPFVRYRARTHAYAVARSHGMSDGAFVALVRDLDAAVVRVAGRGFRATPFTRQAALTSALGLDGGAVWVKDETGNVAGSHKGRHLMGLAILGEVEARLGLRASRGRLAIASCGNAALAAAMVARAWERPLDVFIPDDANPRVVAELGRLGAAVHVCERAAGVAGDPCYHAFRAAVAGGALPFCCQGSDNGLTVEGGETVAWEIVDALGDAGATLDRFFLQVGGGALASACAQGFADARQLGSQVPMPRIHPVQTEGAYPLRRAWERVVARIGVAPGQDDAAVAEQLRGGSREVLAALDHAAHHRADFMWPWETAPHSVAHGILDDETYDWLAVVRATIESGGFPVVVGEARLIEANDLGRERTGIDVDPTGSAGLAGLLELARRGVVRADEGAGVIFSGVRR